MKKTVLNNALGATLILFAATNANAITSTFDSDLEGWAVINNDSGTGTWSSTGGNPDGYAEVTDVIAGAYSWVAPGAFLGDISAFDGGTFSFDAKIFDPGEGEPGLCVTCPPVTGAGVVTITDGVITESLDLAPAGFTSSWVTYSAAFTAAAWGADPTDWANLLDGVTSITINFDATAGLDTTGLDNVQLAAVPIPAAAWLFGSGLLGLVGIARRKNA